MLITKDKIVITRQAFQILMNHNDITPYRANEIFTSIDLNWDHKLDVEEIRVFKEHLENVSFFSKL
eukprot:UN04920